MEVDEECDFSTPLFYSEKEQNGFQKKKSKKMKLSQLDNEITYPKKKKIIKNNMESCDKTETICSNNYDTPSKCTKVICKGELLKKTPDIFNSNYNFKKSIPGPEPFIFNLLTTKSTDLNAMNRFTFDYKNFNVSKEVNGAINVEEFDNNFENKKSKNKTKLLGVGKDKNNAALSKLGKKKLKKTKPTSTKNVDEVDKNVEKNVSESKTSYADIYEVQNRRAVIFHLHHPCKFSFYGELKFTLITGNVEILGYNLNDSSNLKTVEVYSPQKCTPLVVQSNIVENDKTAEIRDLLKNKLSQNSITQILSNFQKNDSILQIEQIHSIFGTVINKFLNISLFPKELENFSSQSEWLKILQSSFNFTTSSTSKDLKKSCEWDKISLDKCTVICGGKGVGKSTLMKYYINKCLSQNEKVVYLDFDPGQSEFTPPGFLSASIVDQPLLGPNFTHLRDGNMMVYFGKIDVSQNPSKYLECVEYVINWCRNNKEVSEMKWLVNTMGFCKGLGVELMISILKILKPTTVIQIWSSENLNNYPFYLTSATVNNEKGFQLKNSEQPHLEFDLRVINSKAELYRHQIRDIFSAKQLRSIMTICYFSQMLLPPYYNFNSVKPYLISFSKLYLGIDFLISPNDVLKAFNGSVVSLCHFEPTSEEILSPERNDFFNIVIKPNVCPSFGLGFIRGIDCKKNKFYVITHLPLERLSKVNCLSLGRLSQPTTLFLNQDTVEVPAVYTSFSTTDIVQQVKRVFRYQSTQ